MKTTIELKPGNFITLGENNRIYRILDVDRDKNSVLIISNDIVCNNHFNNFPLRTTITYKDSTIRKWLNNEFINKAFDNEEKNLILESTLEDDIKDKVFLLSVNEAEKYFKDDNDRAINDECWWLRTDSAKHFASIVDHHGYIYPHAGIVYYAGGIRPALRLNLESKTFNSKNLKIGKIIQFGKYEWRILDINNQEVLLITEDTISIKPFMILSNEWKNSLIRKYLNNEFIKDEFDETYANVILETTLEDNVNDKIFLLSVNEAEKYFKDDNDRTINDECWWLRTKCDNKLCAIYIDNKGDIQTGGRGVDDYRYGIRPALRLNLGSELFKSKINETKVTKAK